MTAADDKVNIDFSLEELILASDAIRFTTVYLNRDRAHAKMSSLLDKVERVIYSEGSKSEEANLK
ncbi:MAG TPA: hypothetical protein VH500_04585 [Nitrososphaeraceae archaeon]|jgi:hypothetical protein